MEEICVNPEISFLHVEIKKEDPDDTANPGTSSEKDKLQIRIKVEEVDDSGNNFNYEEYSNNVNNRSTATITEQMNEITQKVHKNGQINRIECPKCDASFKNRANLKQHLRFVHASDEDVVECKICFRDFKSISHLRTHNSSVHAKDSIVTCDICKKTFLNKKKLNNHLYYSHPDPKLSVACPVCNKPYKSKYNLKIHMRQVHPSENQTVTCDVCDKTFKSQTLLQRHIKWSHPNDGMMYRCPQCGRMLPSILCYKKHVENVHTSGPVTCEMCNQTFKTDKTLARHIKTMHEGIKPEQKQYRVGNLKCNDCPKTFTKTTALFWHYDRCHSDNKRMNTCVICFKEFSDYGSVKRHTEMCHSIETATCHICSKEFKSYFNLQRHIKVTHALPGEEQTCAICNKTFKCAMHLRVHVHSVHPKEGSFTCDICEKVFTSKKYMVKHRKTHTLDKDYPCPLCHKFFKSPSDVNRHKKRVHSNDVVIDLSNS